MVQFFDPPCKYTTAKFIVPYLMGNFAEVMQANGQQVGHSVQYICGKW